MEELVFGRRYRATEKIGTGGMADVYKAVDEVLGRTVAVKVMHAHLAADPSFAARFRQEAQAGANLVSPYIVNMYDWGQDAETYYIVMEYVRGSDLKSIVEQKGALPSRAVAAIGAQVCSALSVAHGYDVIHRDVKPHNIMVQPDGTVKVMDFGIARAGDSMMTQTGTVLGTAHYLSPEQALGKTLTAASDLYALGVVLFEAVTGRLPFDADTPVAVALMQVNEAAPAPSALRSDIDPGLEAAIVRAMQKQTSERYGSADEFRRDLRAVAQSRPDSATAVMASVGAATLPPVDKTSTLPVVGGAGDRASSERTKPGGARKRRPWWLSWIALAALLVVAALGMTWNGGLLGKPDAKPSSVSSQTPLAASGEPVPDVRSMTLAKAKAVLRVAGYTVGDVAEEYGDVALAGKVVGQSPAANAALVSGAEVSLVVGKGTEMVPTPSVVGMSEVDAIDALAAAGFEAQALPAAYSAEVAAGSVCSQTPVGDGNVARGSTVSYALSLGAAPVTEPEQTGKWDRSWKPKGGRGHR